MRRLFMPIVVAAFAVGCGERAVTPTSTLTPREASHDDATPPPPPATGGGSLDFSASDASDGSSADACAVTATLQMNYRYFANSTNNNEFLHIDFGGGPDVRIHQTSSTLTAKGTIAAPGFTFTIDHAVGGDISALEGGAPKSVTVSVQGTLTVGNTTCTANATLTAILGTQIIG